ncbi:C2 domain-containing protein [Globisporangium polare]
MSYNVEVTLHKAADLAAADLNGKSDPYVVFSMGEHSRKSPVVTANLNPVWEPTPKLWFLTDDPNFAVLDVQVLDHDRFTKDDLIGSTTISLGQFFDGNDNNNASAAANSGVRMYELVVPNFFERQNRKSVVMLEIKIDKAHE